MARAASRKSASPIGRRSIVALTLVGLLGIAAIVIWRLTIAVAENRVVRELQTKKRELISLRTTLERDINEASSRARIVPAAERRLGMHVATELEVRNLPVTALRDSVVVDTATADTTAVRNGTSTGAIASNATGRRKP